MARSIYQVSPVGQFQHPWFNKPDTKFAAGGAGVYKCHHHVDGVEAKELAEKITAASEAAYNDYFENGKGKDIKPGDRKKWTIYFPFEEMVEDDGETKTGEIAFAYKQNAEITLRDGSKKNIEITLVDNKEKAYTKPIFSGAEGRLMFSMRPITMVSTKQIGVRLDFAKVQVLKAATSTGPAFGSVDGYDDGDIHEGAGEASEKPTSGPDQDGGGDY